MIISKLKVGCSVGFFGLGKSNRALIDCLPLEGCRITLRSDNEIDESDIPKKIRVERILSGSKATTDIDEDILFFSPSVRRDRPQFLAAKERGVIFSSDTELFLEENDRPLFVITGSDGKSTTTHLTNMLLNEAGHKSVILGNFGVPMWQNLGNVCDFFVCEMSSFMLTYVTPRSVASCITTITPNHLDWHKSYEEYIETKLSVAKGTDKLIACDDNIYVKNAFGIVSLTKSFLMLKISYSAEIYMTIEDGFICKNGKKIISRDMVLRNEDHNIKNLMMAIAMTDGLIENEDIRTVATSFVGLDHRCQIILSRDGIDFIDSSIDSTPARTVQTLMSLNRPVVIILGGRGKGLDYGEMLPSLKKYAKKVIICGENAKEIYSQIGNTLPSEIADSFENAVLLGSEYAKDVGVLLLSPASTSYDRFKNFAERGDEFKRILLEKYSI